MITNFLFSDHLNTDWDFFSQGRVQQIQNTLLTLESNKPPPMHKPYWELSNFPVLSFSQNLLLYHYPFLPACWIQYSNHHFSAFPSCLYSFYPIANTKSTTAVSDFFPAVWYTAWPAPVQHLLQDRWQLHIWVSQCCSSRGPCRLAISIISYFPH